MSGGTLVSPGNGRRVQARALRKDGFGAAKRQVFLDHLAQCANVKQAAGAAGAGVTTAYDLRRRDPLFAAQWDEAVELGYLTLEALLMERAAAGAHYVPGEARVPGPDTIDPELALNMLRIRRTARGPRRAVGPPPRRVSEKALTESILAKLDVLARRKARGRKKVDPGLRRDDGKKE